MEELASETNWVLRRFQKRKLAKELTEIKYAEGQHFNDVKKTTSKRRLLREKVDSWVETNRMRQDQVCDSHGTLSVCIV